VDARLTFSECAAQRAERLEQCCVPLLAATQRCGEHLGAFDGFVELRLCERRLHLLARLLALPRLRQGLVAPAQQRASLGMRVLQRGVPLDGAARLGLGDGGAACLARNALVGVGEAQLSRQLQRARLRHRLLAIDGRLPRLGEREMGRAELRLDGGELGLARDGTRFLAAHILAHCGHLDDAHLLQRLLRLGEALLLLAHRGTQLGRLVLGTTQPLVLGYDLSLEEAEARLERFGLLAPQPLLQCSLPHLVCRLAELPGELCLGRLRALEQLVGSLEAVGVRRQSAARHERGASARSGRLGGRSPV
jgi:hypothetical protein